MSSPHAIVTGGAGFLGSHLVDRLLTDGFRVTAVDNYASGQRANLSHLDEEARFTAVEHDIRRQFPEFDAVDHVYHFASRASPADFDAHAVEIAQTNSVGARRVFELANAHDARVVIASTSEVYGDPDIHPQPEEYAGNVNIRGPRAPYDESKRFAEALAVAHHREHGLDVRTARIFNTYGPKMRPDDGRVVPNFVCQALRGDPLTVYGDGTQTRSFCFVDDLVDGVRRLGDAPPEIAANEAFNIGSTDETSINALAHKVRALLNEESPITHLDRPIDDPEKRRPDITKIRSTLGWEPSTDLESGLTRTATYFKRHLARE